MAFLDRFRKHAETPVAPTPAAPAPAPTPATPQSYCAVCRKFQPPDHFTSNAHILGESRLCLHCGSFRTPDHFPPDPPPHVRDHLGPHVERICRGCRTVYAAALTRTWPWFSTFAGSATWPWFSTLAALDAATIGTNDQGEPVTLDRATRNKHLYLIGKSRTGKTTLMLNLMRGDLEAGDGLTFIDPAGDAAHQLLGYVPASRAEHVTYFDPTRDDCPALNLLALPYDRDKLAGEIVSAFRLFFDSWGPRMGMLLRNGLLALLDDRDHTPHSIADLERLFIDEDYRDTIARRATDPRVKRFLNDDLPRFERSALDPVLNKLDAFLSTRTLARLFGATDNALDFNQLLNDRRVLVCSLSKGKIGEEPAKFLGGLIVAALTVAALARADQPPAARADHFLYVDEFQNFAVSSFATIFAEAAKYRLNLTVAHQTRDQLTPEIRAALGNASTYVVFRISADDASALAPELRTPRWRFPDGRPYDVAGESARQLAERRAAHDRLNVPLELTERWRQKLDFFASLHQSVDKDTRNIVARLHQNAIDEARAALDLSSSQPADVREEPWPTAGDIVNLQNLHAFARIERPENTTAITVPFPPPDDVDAAQSRAAVLSAQAQRARKPQEPRTSPPEAEPTHQNSTTFDVSTSAAVHSPDHDSSTTTDEERPTRRLPRPRRRS